MNRKIPESAAAVSLLAAPETREAPAAFPPPPSPQERRVERIGIVALLALLAAYALYSWGRDRLYVFEDDFIRMALARYWAEQGLWGHPWGAHGWLPATTALFGALARLSPLPLAATCLLANLAFSLLSLALLWRLGTRFARGWAALAPPALLLFSPAAAWLATSALSEPLALAANLGALLLAAQALERRDARRLAWAAGPVALATMIRHEAWFTTLPLAWAAVAVFAWREKRKRQMGRAFPAAGAMALATLPALSWMAAAWIRYGSPLANLASFVERHEAHNAGETFALALRRLAAAAIEVNPAGWLLAGAALVWIAMMWRRGLRRESEADGARWRWVAAGAIGLGASGAALFFYSMLTHHWGFPVARFLVMWWAALAPLVAALGARRRGAWILAAGVAAQAAFFFPLDARRPDLRGPLGVSAARAIREAGRAQAVGATDGKALLVGVAYPESEPEWAANTLFSLVPEARMELLRIARPDAAEFRGAVAAREEQLGRRFDFLLARWSVFGQPPGAPEALAAPSPAWADWRLIYRDSWYAVFAPRVQ